jgi:hypothetical protein
MKYIFIAFYGWPDPPMNQEEKVYITDEHFECWNLRKFSASEFMDAIKVKIPPINDNVLINYLNDGTGLNGISDVQYQKCLWGLLLPDPEDIYNDGYREVLALLNLFSTKYMHPSFYATQMGINKISEFKNLDVLPNDHQEYAHFKTSNFVSFYKAMIKEAKYSTWKRDNVLEWSKEDWRLYMASIFYDGLEEYERSKSVYTWQRESADMATLLETLFTAGDTQNEEIGYRLRKRIATLIQWKFNDIEKDIKVLYKDRSEFVHGSYYKNIISGMNRNPNDNAMPPSPDFEKLYKTKEQLRFIFVAYLYLHKIMISQSEPLFNSYENVQGMLENAIINTELRTKITETIKPTIELLPIA